MKHRSLQFVESPDGLDILDRLRAGGDGVHTSMGENYNNTVFGRDTALVGDMLVNTVPEITHNAILAEARLQGVALNKKSNEQLGRIHHEYRPFRDWRANIFKKAIFERLISPIWGGEKNRLLTYFSMDSTPLYTLMVANYAREHPEILQKSVRRLDGKEVTIEQSVLEASEWMMSQVNSEGLVTVPRGNPFSLIHQTWKDSPTGYIRPDGKGLNIDDPIAYLEVQGLTVKALARSSDILEENNHEFADRMRQTASVIRRATMDRFWLEKEQYFASAIEKGKHGQDVVVETVQSDPAWLLGAGIFDDLEDEEREKYVSGVVRRLFSKDFLTDAGVRARSVRYHDKLALTDYHGSYTVWPIDSYMLVRGLRRQNLPLLADQLEARLLDAINKAGNFYEFFFADANGNVVYDPQEATTPYQRQQGQRVTQLAPGLMPESNLAWTVALGIRLRHDEQLPPEKTGRQTAWQRELQDEIMKSVKHFSLAKVLSQKEQVKPTRPPVEIHPHKGEVLFAAQVVEALGASMVHRLWRKVGATAASRAQSKPSY